MDRNVTIATAAASGLAAGFALGWIAGVRRARHLGVRELESQIADVKRHYRARAAAASAAEGPDDAEWLASLDLTDGDAGTTEAGSVPSEVDEVPAGTTPAEWLKKETRGVVDEELARADEVDVLFNRDKTQPYLITAEEFAEEKDSWQKLTITYYEVDGVLVDDQDSPIPRFASVVGVKFKEQFGLHSGDKNIVFIRNEKMETDFEITLDHRSYIEVVAGYGNPAEQVRRSPPRS